MLTLRTNIEISKKPVESQAKYSGIIQKLILFATEMLGGHLKSTNFEASSNLWDLTKLLLSACVAVFGR